MWSRCAGTAVPVHLAAHIRACVTGQHAGHQLLPHAVPNRGVGTMSATAAGAAHRRGLSAFCSSGFTVENSAYTAVLFEGILVVGGMVEKHLRFIALLVAISVTPSVSLPRCS